MGMQDVGDEVSVPRWFWRLPDIVGQACQDHALGCYLVVSVVVFFSSIAGGAGTTAAFLPMMRLFGFMVLWLSWWFFVRMYLFRVLPYARAVWLPAQSKSSNPRKEAAIFFSPSSRRVLMVPSGIPVRAAISR